MDVEMVRWPSRRQRRDQLAAARLPRLLLVEPDAPAPVAVDPLEDWVRLPVDRNDLQARIDALSARGRDAGLSAPRLDEWGVLRFGGRQVTLPPLEARLAVVLVESYKGVVRRDDLTRAGWPGDNPGRNALDVHILRLRRRVEPLGLSIRTVRSRGYLLEPATALSRVSGMEG
ncbi:MAG: helix-turn-helix domain-containing protein [Acidimicrobiales bacterium]|nr:helix-turn-helix domain-containing protein [Acidimicrobiales bacterium]